MGRVTQALTAGVVGVSLDQARPVPRFVLLTARPSNAVLEIFEEPVTWTWGSGVEWKFPDMFGCFLSHLGLDEDTEFV